MALTLCRDLSTAGESLTLYSPFGQEITKISQLPPPNAAGDVFIGVLSAQPIGSVLFAESGDDRDPVGLERMHFGIAPAHLLEDMPMAAKSLFWLAFNGFILTMLMLDMMLGRKHVIMLREALLWSIVWIGLALLFDGWIFALRGRGPAVVWLTAYLLEKFLSVDNLFVFLTIFASFHTPTRLQHKVRAMQPQFLQMFDRWSFPHHSDNQLKSPFIITHRCCRGVLVAPSSFGPCLYLRVSC